MTAQALQEVDTVEIHVIVNDEVDFMSPSCSAEVAHPGRMMQLPLASLSGRAGAEKELKMANLCCGALGLSMMITVTKGDRKHVMLFDAGPQERLWENNVAGWGLDVSAVEHIHLSHWHRDHSGGLLAAIRVITAAKGSSTGEKVVMEVHPDRPDARGFTTPVGVVSMELEASLDDLEKAGASLSTRSEPHLILDDTFLVSGEIPRRTAYEVGIPAGVRYISSKQEWAPDPLIMDERFVMVNLKGKGLVVFTGCSHAGVVNVCNEALRLAPSVPLYAVVGGYHLAGVSPEISQATMQDLKTLAPKVFMPGHCTGWQFKFQIEQEFPTRMVPIFGGGRYVLGATTPAGISIAT